MTRVLPRLGAVEVPAPRARSGSSSGSTSPPATRYLGWMTTFDEAGRLSLYTDAHLDRLATAAALDPTRPRPTRPRSWTRACAAAPTARPGHPGHGRRPPDVPARRPPGRRSTWRAWRTAWSAAGPFLDHRVVELAAPCRWTASSGSAPGRSKVVLKQAFADLLPTPIRTRRKMGFGVPDRPLVPGRAEGTSFATSCWTVSLDRGLFRPEAIKHPGRRARRGPPRARPPALGPRDARTLVPEPPGRSLAMPRFASCPRAQSCCPVPKRPMDICKLQFREYPVPHR